MRKLFNPKSVGWKSKLPPSSVSKPNWIERNRKVLGQHAHRKLKLATELGELPGQWKLPAQEANPKVFRIDRRLAPLRDAMHPYPRYSQEAIDKITFRKSTFYDPLFNPNVYDEHNRINPEEEPFNAIYLGHEDTEGGQQYTKVRNVTSPDLWEYVKRLARIKIAPEVKRRKPNEPLIAMSSGFIPPPEEPPNLPYFIARTRNHLLPVYYWLENDSEKCVTLVKNVMGDIWKFEEDLRSYLESLNKSGERILTSVQEPDEVVEFKGKHLHDVVDWLHGQGF